MTIFLVLGAMEIRTRRQTVQIRGTGKQTLLAALLASGDRLVTVDTLAEELWGTTPPPTMENALQAQVSRLRQTMARLEPERRTPRLTTAASGYRFEVEWTELDALSFLHTVEMIRNRAGSSPARDVTELRNTLALWRGPVFGGLIGGSLCQTVAARYEESRTAALELLYDLELRIGNHARIVPELTELVAGAPMKEQFCSLFMVALYRCGRQTDALEVYRQMRQRMVDDLGVEPSPVLRRYEKAILDHDPILMNEDQHASLG